MAQPYVTGPAHFFISISGSAFAYLGTFERGLTTFDFIPEWDDVVNDIGGTKFPLFSIYEGEQGMAGGPLTRWNEGAYAIVNDLPHFAGRGRGLDLPGDIGTVPELEVRMQTYVDFPYGVGGLNAKATMATLPVGYHFYNSILRQNRRSPIGTGQNQIQLLWENRRYYDAAGVLGKGAGALICYDNIRPALPPID